VAGRPPGAGYRDKSSSLRELALAVGKYAAVGVSWREGTRGLDHFEGRSFRGWHHHVTCVSVVGAG
jgi:hypothetical protein